MPAHRLWMKSGASGRAENLGHATAAFTLDVYGHVSERMKEDSAARMQGYFENLKKARKKLRRSHHRRSCFCPR